MRAAAYFLFLGLLVMAPLSLLSCDGCESRDAASTKVPGAEPSVSASFKPMAAEVTASSATLWTRSTGEADVRFELADNARFERAKVTDSVHVDQSGDFVAQVRVEGLKGATEYHYRPVFNGAMRGSTGRFRTPPVRTGGFSAAWSADLLASYQPFTILESVRQLEPDLFLMLGDATYANHPKSNPAKTLPQFRQKHRDVRASEELQSLLSEVGTYAIWDDHDTLNNTHRAHPLMKPSRRAFRDYWPVEAAAGASPGLYRSFSWGPDADFFIIDCRTFRDPPNSPEPRTMLGKKQLAWLRDGIAASKARFKILVSSVPFLAPFEDDSWLGFPEERDQIKQTILQNAVTGVVVLSADFHLAWELVDDATGIHEYIAGPLAAWPFAQIKKRHLGAVQASGRFSMPSEPNFGMIAVEGDDSGEPVLVIRYYDQRGQRRFERRLGGGTSAVHPDAAPPR